MRAFPPVGAVLVTLTLVLTPLAATSATAAPATAAPDGPTRVIATLETPSAAPSAAAIDAVRSEVLDDLPTASYDVVADYAHLPAVALEVDDAGLAALRDDPRVSTVQPDRPRQLFDTEANALTGATTAHSSGYTGAGATIAVIDTGVDQTGGAVHPGLADDLRGQRCFRGQDHDCPGGTAVAGTAPDSDGHGTHVAGIITGPDGVAPDAGFYALKVFGDDGSSWDSDILAALSYVVGLNSDGSAGNDVDAVNLSLGGEELYASRSACAADPANGPYRDAFASLNARRVAVFVATGNDGATTGVAAPACVDGAIGVGSVDDAGYSAYFPDAGCVEHGAPDRVSCFSNTTAVQGTGELVDLLAPGCMISSLGLHGADAVVECGTSMATPYAAGSAALVLQAAAGAGLAPTPAGLENLLENTGRPVRDTRLAAGPRFPRVAPLAAITSLTQPLTTSISVSSPANGASYLRGSTVRAAFSCGDNRGGDGVVSCVGSRASGAALDTAQVGPHTFTVTLRDTEGRTTTATRTYTVVGARPDGRVRRAGTSRLVGDGVYGSAARQSVGGRAATRRSVTYVVSAQNDSRAADRLRIAGGRAGRGFTVRYYSATGRPITSAVTRGTFLTPALAPGAAYQVKVVVTTTARARRARPLATAVTLRSAGNPTVADAVRMVTRRR